MGKCTGENLKKTGAWSVRLTRETINAYLPKFHASASPGRSPTVSFLRMPRSFDCSHCPTMV
uniref:Uncharacterized protein n=1 Tax=Romanomermis culicivorax TaxID=13658 RepID=A0A915KUQ9_ROMCU